MPHGRSSLRTLLLAVLGVLAAIALVLTSLLGRDAVAAADQREEIPAALTEVTPDSEQTAGGTADTSQQIELGPKEPDRLQFAAFTPEHLFIPGVDVNTTVDPRPSTTEFNPFLGQEALTFPVPDDAFTTVWWDEGPLPGDGGLAIILGHARTPRAAVFNDLPHVGEGATVGLTGRTAEGQAVTGRYRVDRVVTGISKLDAAALRAVLDDPPAGSTLALITCSGDIDEVLSSRVDNTVVFATLTSVHPDT